MTSFFDGVEPVQADPILSLSAQFNADPSPDKIILGVGAYRDAEGKPFVLPSVRMAEEYLHRNSARYDHEYPPQAGYPGFLKVAQELLFGAECRRLRSGQVASCQSLSGTGALYILNEFIRDKRPEAAVYLAEQTWPNHHGLYRHTFGRDAPLYPYLDVATMRVDMPRMVAFIRGCPEGSVFLLQACAHNPSGIDPTQQQWRELLEVFLERRHVAFFDIAYQGFATGSFEDDGFAVRLFAAAGVECLVAQSFAKNFGLYGERVGCAHVVHNGGPEMTAALQSNLVSVVRNTWSLCPIYGARIVQTIGENPEMYRQFLEDVRTMSGRIGEMRRRFYEAVRRHGAPGSWECVRDSIGMFSMTPLSRAQVEYLRERHHIYLVGSGRMSVSGLTEGLLERVAACVADAARR